MARKYFSNTAVATTLAASISDADSSLTVNSSTGYPAVPFTIAINAGTSTEEVILVAAKSGTTFSTLTRGHDGSTARAHTSGASVKHVAAAEDFTGLYTHDHDTADGHAGVDVTDATGLLPTNRGGTGLSSLGSAGQVLKINSGANALEYGTVEAVFNIDGMTDGSGVTIADADKFPMSDGGTEKYVNASQIKTYVGPRTDEEIADIVGAMFSGNTETRISATYEDGDNTIDLVVDDMTANTQLSTEQVQDIVGAMFSANTETRISATYEDGDGTIDLVVDDMTTNTQLTQEQVEDFVGGMLDGTETFITVTYDDTDGNIDFVVPVKDEDNMASDSATHLATQQSIKAYVDDVAQTSEEIADIVGAMFTSNTETRISATYQDGDNTIDLVVDDMTADTNTQLTQEQVEDYVGGMLDGTETFITATYDDTDGNIDFVVPVKDEDNMASDSATFLATQQSIKAYVDANAGLSLIDEDDMATDSATRPPSQQSVKAFVEGKGYADIGLIIALG
tara:strand:- start:955 stop:2484 length:1530 start_codon:yes stop_codon:yes gene_type:complete